MITISIDALGGDYGSTPIIEGTIQALREKKFKAILVGRSEEILPKIPKNLKK